MTLNKLLQKNFKRKKQNKNQLDLNMELKNNFILFDIAKSHRNLSIE